MVRHCTCGLYFTRRTRWLVTEYKSPLVQYLTTLHSTPYNNILYGIQYIIIISDITLPEVIECNIVTGINSSFSLALGRLSASTIDWFNLWVLFTLVYISNTYNRTPLFW